MSMSIADVWGDVEQTFGWTTTPPPEQLFGVGWEAYYGIVMWSASMQLISVVAITASAFQGVRRALRRREGEALRVREPVAVVLPCYLPNEEPIIKGTIQHILDALERIDSLTVYVVYNTPHGLPIEMELKQMAKEVETAGRRLVVQRVDGSKSKAENLNFILPEITAPYCAIYDADHHPDPESLAMAVWHLKETDSDCVQGSTYIREGCPLGRWLVCAEFFVNYFVVLPAMQCVAGTGFFGGANGIWRTASLQRLRFDESALTEDIDCFARAITQHGFRFEFLPECCSGELLPAGCQALWKQRLRWAMGWDQVTLKHAAAFWDSKLSMRRRFGLSYIFFCRWLTQTCALFIVVFNAKAAFDRVLFEASLWQVVCAFYGWNPQNPDAADGSEPMFGVPPCVQDLQVASFSGYMLFMAYAFSRALLHGSFAVMPGLLMYFTFMPVIVLCNSFLLIISLLRVSSGSTGSWVVTARAHRVVSTPSSATLVQAMKEPLLGPNAIAAQATEEHRRLATMILAAAFATSGTLAGAVVGAIVGQRTVVRPLWGWVPFGIGATRTTVTDGRVVALCMAVGACLALIVFSATVLWRGRAAAARQRSAEEAGAAAAPPAAGGAEAAAVLAA